MRGEVLKAAIAGEDGTILGTNGQRYTYSVDQVRSSDVIRNGQSVDFVDLGQVARDIYVLAASPSPVAYTSQVMTPQPNYLAVQGTLIPADGLWTYFTRTLTTNYANFNGRARRTEYWGYTLFWWIILIALLTVDAVIFGLTTDFESSSPGFIWFFYLTILWSLATFLPNIAIVVRRLHDLDMSGWLYLVKFADIIGIPLGSLFIFVITLLEGKPAINQHGPSPKFGGVEQIDAFS